MTNRYNEKPRMMKFSKNDFVQVPRIRKDPNIARMGKRPLTEFKPKNLFEKAVVDIIVVTEKGVEDIAKISH